MIDYIDIRQLIPQRQPIMMVDALVEADEQSATSRLIIRDNNFFLQEDGCLGEVGLIEHMAQTASAHAGYMAFKQGVQEAPIGYIGEVKGFCLYMLPKKGDELTTTVQIVLQAGNVTVVNAMTKVDDSLVAETQLKISLKE